MIDGQVLVGAGIWVIGVGEELERFAMLDVFFGGTFIQQDEALSSVLAWTPYPIVIAGANRFGQSVFRPEEVNRARLAPLTQRPKLTLTRSSATSNVCLLVFVVNNGRR